MIGTCWVTTSWAADAWAVGSWADGAVGINVLVRSMLIMGRKKRLWFYD